MPTAFGRTQYFSSSEHTFSAFDRMQRTKKGCASPRISMSRLSDDCGERRKNMLKKASEKSLPLPTWICVRSVHLMGARVSCPQPAWLVRARLARVLHASFTRPVLNSHARFLFKFAHACHLNVRARSSECARASQLNFRTIQFARAFHFLRALLFWICARISLDSWRTFCGILLAGHAHWPCKIPAFLTWNCALTVGGFLGAPLLRCSVRCR